MVRESAQSGGGYRGLSPSKHLPPGAAVIIILDLPPRREECGTQKRRSSCTRTSLKLLTTS